MTRPDVPAGLVVAIDGPSGSGKSSVARGVARELGLAYLDTGAMYRAATWWCLHNNVSLPDAAAITRTVSELPLQVSTDPQLQFVRVGEQDVSVEIREASVTAAVSAVSAVPQVREQLIELQRQLIRVEQENGFSQGQGIVVEGRDITTVVAPQSPVRLLLTASEQARLARRALEVHGSADQASTSATRDQIVQRDAADSKVTSFIAPAEGVVVVDSTELDLPGTIAAVLQVVREQLQPGVTDE